MGLRLDAAGLNQGKPIINTVTGKATHIFFGFRLGRESSLAREFKIMAVGIVYITFP